MKKIFAVILAGVMVLSLCSCGDVSSEDKSDESSDLFEEWKQIFSDIDDTYGSSDLPDQWGSDSSDSGDSSELPDASSNEIDEITYESPDSSTETIGNSSQTSNSVYYSTNDFETAKNGNSGVFAYSHRASSYDIYWIIDFDEGYVYYFTEGNENDICDRLKIDSGDLNSVLIVTYHDGGDSWSNGLHFKWKSQPENMIHQDNDGFETKFIATDLDDALEIRDTKTMIDY